MQQHWIDTFYREFGIGVPVPDLPSTSQPDAYFDRLGLIGCLSKRLEGAFTAFWFMSSSEGFSGCLGERPDRAWAFTAFWSMTSGGSTGPIGMVRRAGASRPLRAGFSGCLGEGPGGVFTAYWSTTNGLIGRIGEGLEGFTRRRNYGQV